jgi:TonB family protein
MTQDQAFNIVTYLLQTCLILLPGLVLPRLVGLKSPRLQIVYWRSLLLFAATLPLLVRTRGEPLPPIFSATQEVIAGLVPGNLSTVEAPSLWPMLIWGLIAIAGLRLAGLFAGLMALHVYRRNARDLSPVPLLRHQLKNLDPSKVEFLVSKHTEAPVTFGWIRPTVLVPESFQELTPQQQGAVLCHELLHIQRSDWISTILEETARSLLWFHVPFTTLLNRLALSREQMVDWQVITITGDRKAYAEALRKVASHVASPAFLPVLSITGKRDLVQRVSLLYKEVTMSRPHVLAAFSVLAFALIASASISASLFTYKSPTSESLEASVQPAWQAQAEEEKLQKPKLVKKIAPHYPEEARKEQLSGKVVCSVLITKEGKVTEPEIVESAHEIFNQPVIDAITQWEYEPGTKDDTPVDIRITVTVNFQLK